MSSSEAVARLMWHAGAFPASGSELPEGSMSTATWTLVGIEGACENLLRTLEEINVELNESTTSEVDGSDQVDALPRQLVWGVERILTQMEEVLQKSSNPDQQQLLASLVERVKFWWRCVIDGDIDDIQAEWQIHLQA